MTACLTSPHISSNLTPATRVFGVGGGRELFPWPGFKGLGHLALGTEVLLVGGTAGVAYKGLGHAGQCTIKGPSVQNKSHRLNGHLEANGHVR